MTRAGFAMMLVYFAAPIMAALIGFDIILYFVMRHAFDICYGVWCWF